MIVSALSHDVRGQTDPGDGDTGAECKLQISPPGGRIVGQSHGAIDYERDPKIEGRNNPERESLDEGNYAGGSEDKRRERDCGEDDTKAPVAERETTDCQRPQAGEQSGSAWILSKWLDTISEPACGLHRAR